MSQPTITFVINDKTFSLRADDTGAIAAIPTAERGQLLALLEALKRQDEQAAATARELLDRAKSASNQQPAAARTNDPAPSPERLGSGDIDALMARLVMEESRNRKPAPTRQSLYRGLLALVALAVLLIVVF
jgi:hypothetical protein